MKDKLLILTIGIAFAAVMFMLFFSYTTWGVLIDIKEAGASGMLR